MARIWLSFQIPPKGYHANDKLLWIDLLDPLVEDEYAKRPETLSQQISANKDRIEWVIIDEIQKAPKLLDLVHYHIENSGVKFALTGSSARKLKRGSANLLAGRAFVNSLFPLTHIELENSFDILQTLQYGTLPKLFHLQNDEEKMAFLKAYAITYLKEEVWAEHILKDLPNAKGYCFSQDHKAKKIGNVLALHWREGFKEISLL